MNDAAERLDDTVADAMSTDAVAVRIDVTAAAALDIARQNGAHYLLVMAGDRVVGLTCPCDLNRVPPGARVPEACAGTLVTVEGTSSLEAAYEIMSRRAVGCLPVMDRNRVIGLLRRGDLARAGVAASLADACAACGTHHGLAEPRTPGLPTFCRSCLEQSKRDETGLRDTLGGEGG